MKKSAKYIYPRPVSRRRHPWRWLGLTACAAAVASLFVFHDDLIGMTRLFASSVASVENALLTGARAPFGRTEGAGSASGENAASPPARALPVPAAEPAALSSREIAALAVAAEERPERPGMLAASVGESISHLQSLPFLLPTPEEERDVVPTLSTSVTALTEMFRERDMTGPVVYADNERYTVETDDSGHQIFRSVVAKGDTAGVILNEWLPAGDVMSLINASAPVFSLTTIREGRPFSVERDAQRGDFIRFVYEMDNTRRLVAERRDASFVAVVEPIEYDTELVKVRGAISTSLFEAVADTGEGPVLAVNLADVFSCEINFINEIRQGDSFEVLVEKLYRDGEFKGYGKMLAAYFENQGHNYEAYLFTDAKGRLRYYNARGEALQKALLKAPLAFTRISSGYSMSRKHPVFGYSRPHQGVDYAAPTGTPIKAVGDGVIIRAGWGNGYGNMVVIKHSGGLESQYAHMSGFARGIKSRVRVKQGQTIGYVGATGVATGPHLDFRLKQNGRFINPTKVIVPREAPVAKKRLPAFQEMVALAQSYLKGETALAEYSPEAWPY